MTAVDITEQEPALYRSAIALSEEADAAAAGSGLPAGFVELVKVRVSQLNGCAFCLRWHTRRAVAAGEDSDRVAVLAAWWETTYFDETERAALALAEHVARIGERRPDGTPDIGALSPQQVAAVTWVTIATGTLNRIAITSGYVVEPEA